jgi:hypothetical protein
MAIEIVEMHISNRCSANCCICSKHHGGNNPHLVTDEVIKAAIEQIKVCIEKDRDHTKPVIQLGGDGDSFLHPHFLEYCRWFKNELPQLHRCLYTNAFLLTKSRAYTIVCERLLHQMETRIDSLDPQTYYESMGLILKVTLAHLEYFMSINDYVDFCAMYFPLFRYRHFCRKVLDKEPTYFGRIDENRLTNEWPKFDQHFKGLPTKKPIRTRISGISLWAERTDCLHSAYPCPRHPEQYPGDMSRQVYIYPNGNIGLCGYDDKQDTFILGNILKDDLYDTWVSSKREEYIEKIRTEDFLYECCVNAKACVMWVPDTNGDPVNPADGKPKYHVESL